MMERREALVRDENGCAGDLDAARARAPAALIPQPHGGAICAPWTSGTGAAARRSSVRAARKESLGLLAAATPEATERLIALMRSDDERVATIAAQEIMNRVHGRIGEPPPEAADAGGESRFSPRLLSGEERVRLADALATIAELATLARQREEEAAP